MNKFFLKIFMAMNTFAIRLSGGCLGTQTILLLHTVGRKFGTINELEFAIMEVSIRVI